MDQRDILQQDVVDSNTGASTAPDGNTVHSTDAAPPLHSQNTHTIRIPPVSHSFGPVSRPLQAYEPPLPEIIPATLPAASTHPGAIQGISAQFRATNHSPPPAGASTSQRRHTIFPQNTSSIPIVTIPSDTVTISTSTPSDNNATPQDAPATTRDTPNTIPHPLARYLKPNTTPQDTLATITTHDTPNTIPHPLARYLRPNNSPYPTTTDHTTSSPHPFSKSLHLQVPILEAADDQNTASMGCESETDPDHTSPPPRTSSLKNRVSFNVPEIQTCSLNRPSPRSILARNKIGGYPQSAASMRRPRGLPILSRPLSALSGTQSALTPRRSRMIMSRPKGISPFSHSATPMVREIQDLGTVSREVQFFTKTVEQTAVIMKTDPDKGLTDAEALTRLNMFGKNLLKTEKKVSGMGLFIHHMVSVLNLILLAAAAASIISAVIEGSYAWIEGIFIIFIIFTNTLIGFSQEYRSVKTMESLKNLFAPEADVTRNGERKTVAAEDLVIGDIVHIEDGDFVPADLRIIESIDLSINESILTGESNPVSKLSDPLEPEEAQALGDQFNMAFMSTVVVSGRGKGVVVQTGEATQLGDIAMSLRSSDKDKKKTHLQKMMRTLGWVLFMLAISLSVIVLAIQVLAVGAEAFQSRRAWMYLVALCVSIIPEGLPSVLAVTLAAGMRSMARKKAIVRKLGVLESVNWITDICTDKTGTLTEGKMMATMIWTEGKYYKVSGSGIIPEGQIYERGGSVVPVDALKTERVLALLLRTCSLCNNATLTHENDEWRATSSPTEIALQVLAYKAGMGKPALEETFEFLGEHPFDSNVKRMSVIYRLKRDALAEPSHRGGPSQNNHQLHAETDEERTFLFMKGSLEAVLKKCKTHRNHDNEEEPIDDAAIRYIQKQADFMASRGLRVLAFAEKTNFHFDSEENRDIMDAGSSFLGLVGIMDPPRVQSKPAVEKANEAGITVYMLTGDHKKTAESIAQQVSIIRKPTDYVMVGSQFEQRKIPGDLPKVVARCNPKTKIRMIEELHERGSFVCMTGDGVNDAPAIKAADVGIAMGLGGSEVTKEVADIVLLDDNFGTIIVAVEEGRRIFTNIEKILLHLLTNNFALILILVLGLIYSFFTSDNHVVFPLTPMQVLWLNVITDTPMNSALGLEPVSRQVMKRPPRTKTEGLFTLSLNIDLIVYGTTVGVLSLANFGITLFTGEPQYETRYGKTFSVREYLARAVCFVTILYCMLMHLLIVAVQNNSILTYHFRNPWVPFTMVMGAILVFPTLYIPWVAEMVFEQVGLGWIQWIQVLVAMAIFVTCAEFWKLFKKCVNGIIHNTKVFINLVWRMTESLQEMSRVMRMQTNRDKEEEIPLTDLPEDIV